MNRLNVAGLLGLGLLTALPAAALPGAEVGLTSEYTYRWAQRSDRGDETDQDLRTGLALDVPALGGEAWQFSGRLDWLQDLDGTGETSVYKDTLDSYSNRNDWRLYRARLRYRDPAGRFRVDAGRLEVWSAETATLDGALAEFTPCRWASLDVYGGRRVSFYSDPEKRAIVGGDLDLRPWQGGRVRIQDLYYLENNLEASLTQQLGGWGTGRAAVRAEGSDLGDATLGLFLVPWRDADLTLEYRRLFNDYEYDFTADEDDPVENLFFAERQPYADYAVTLRQGLFGVLGVGVRLRHHAVVADDDEDATNVDFDEGTLLMDLSEWPWRGLRLAGSATRWVEDRNRDDLTEDELWGFALHLEQTYRGHAVGAGLYKQAYDTDGGSRDTAGYDLWARLRLCAAAAATLRYERETDDLYRADGIDALNQFTASLDLTF